MFELWIFSWKNHGILSDDLSWSPFNFSESKFLLTQAKEASKWEVREENEVVKVPGRCSAYNQQVQCVKTLSGYLHSQESKPVYWNITMVGNWQVPSNAF